MKNIFKIIKKDVNGEEKYLICFGKYAIYSTNTHEEAKKCISNKSWDFLFMFVLFISDNKDILFKELNEASKDETEN